MIFLHACICLVAAANDGLVRTKNSITCQSCWHTRSTEREKYPRCSTDGGVWKETWSLSALFHLEVGDNLI